MPITIAICDEDKNTREVIKHLIKNQYENCRLDLYDSDNGLLEANIEYEIYILEINMPDVNGLKMAEQLRKRQAVGLQNGSIIIFVSTLKEYMADAFDVKAYHYLLKPIDENKFNDVFSRAINDCRKRKECVEDHILIKSGNSYHKLLFEDIYYVESRDKKIIINSVDGVMEYYGKIQELENTLDNSFFRCHRCYIVNMEHITRYNANTIWVKNGDGIYLAQKKYTAFVKTFKIFTRNGDGMHGIYKIDM